MRLTPLILALACTLPAAVQAQDNAPPARPARADAAKGLPSGPPSPLFAALGGREGLAAVSRGLVDRMATDPRIRQFFEKTDRAALTASLADQLCNALGGPCKFTVKMRAAHEDMKITRTHFNIVVELLQDAMDDAKVPFHTQTQLLALLAPMHRDIITLH